MGVVGSWLRHVQDVRNAHLEFLQSLPEDKRGDALVELKVLEQARNVCLSTVVEDAWVRGQTVVVHGWVYGLANGLLKDPGLHRRQHGRRRAGLPARAARTPRAPPFQRR